MPDLEQFNITDASRGAAFTVHVVPEASESEIVGIQQDGTIKIRLMAPPVEGQLNEALIQFLAHILHVDVADVGILAGENSLKKLITVLNIRAEEVDKLVREVSPEGNIDEQD